MTDHAWAAWSSERSRRARSRETSGVLARVRGNKAAGADAASMGGLGWYYVHAERFGATLQDRGHVTGTRGLHKGATLRARSYIQPELYFLAVSGQFHDLVKRRKNRLRGSRAPSGGAPGRAHPVGNAQRARRRLAGLARGTGSGRAKCT